MLIESQKEFKMVVKPELISVGRRKPDLVFGTKLQDMMYKSKMTIDMLINEIGNSYRANIERVLENQEIPKKQLIDKLCKIFDATLADFTDTELENVVCVQNGIIIGRYKTNARALEVCKEAQAMFIDSHKDNKNVVYTMPEA